MGIRYNVRCSSWARIVDFLLVLIEVFLLGVTAESLQAKRSKIGDFAQRVQFDPKFQVNGVAPHQSFLHD